MLERYWEAMGRKGLGYGENGKWDESEIRISRKLERYELVERDSWRTLVADSKIG